MIGAYPTIAAAFAGSEAFQVRIIRTWWRSTPLSFETDALERLAAADGRQKRKNTQRVHAHQGVGDARREGRDRRESGRPLVERIELPPPARLGDASSIDDRSAGYSGLGEDQRRPRAIRRTDQDVVNHERRF